MKALLLTPDSGGIKSVPLNALPREAWTNVLGGEDDQQETGTLYKKVPWLYRAVNIRTEALLNVPRSLHEGTADGEEREEYTINNMSVDTEALLGTWTLHLTMYGAAYAIVERNRYGVVKGLRPVMPSSVTPQYNQTEGLVGFERRVKGDQYLFGVAGTDKAKWPAGAVGDMAYCWLPNHAAETGPGIAPASVAAAAAGVLLNTDMFVEQLFRQGTMMPTVIFAEEGASDNEVQRLESWAKRTMSGIKNAFRLTAVSGKMGSLTLGSPVKDTQAPELTDQKRQDIATALGIPQTLLFSDAASYATAGQDDMHFYDKTILPLWKKMGAALNRQVFQPAGYTLVEHHEKMEIYQRQETAKAYGLAQLWTTNAVPREYLWDMMALGDNYRSGTFYADIIQPTANAGASANLAKPPDLPDVPTVDAPETPDMMKSDMDRWQRVAVKRMREGKRDKALGFESDAIPAALAGAIRGMLRNVQTVDDVPGVFARAAVWGSYP